MPVISGLGFSSMGKGAPSCATRFSAPCRTGLQQGQHRLFQLRPGVDPQKAKADLKAIVPEHTLVFTRSELLQQERDYFSPSGRSAS